MVSSNNPPNALDFRLLGPLTVLVDGVVVPTGGPRQVAVLARLMLSPNQAVTMDQLVESVWDGDEPTQPQVTLRSYVSNLRRAIEPHRRRRASESCLLSTPSGYRLAVDPGSIDGVRFELAVDRARADLAAGDSRSAINALRQALELWVGVPFAGLPESPVLLAHRGRLTDLRATAIELLFEAQLAVGEHHSVAGQVEAAIAENPLRERFTELGMLALYRSSRQSEALALGQRLRTRLRNELGVAPGPGIESIELKILNHDPALDVVETELVADSRATVASPVMPSNPRARTTRSLGSTPGPTPASLPAGQAQPSANSSASESASSFMALEVLPPSPPVGGRPSPFQLQVDARTQPAAAPDRAEATPNGTGPAVSSKPGRTKLAERDDVRLPRLLLDEAGLVGRQAEMSTADTVIDALAASRSITVAVTGDHGIGKSALARSIVDAATGSGTGPATVTWSLGDQSDEPLWLWSQVVLGLLPAAELRPAADSRPAAELRPLTVLGPAVAGTLGLEPGQVQDEQSYSDHDVTLALVSLLERLSVDGPVLVVLEDLQWADERSLSLLPTVAAALAQRPVAFVLTWRSPIDVAVAPALRSLTRMPGLIRLDLDGVDATDIEQLAHYAGIDLASGEAAHIHRLCDGNPLLARELIAEGAGGRSDMSPSPGRAGHHSPALVDIVIGRVEAIHADARAVLAAAAVHTTPFTVEEVAELLASNRGANDEPHSEVDVTAVIEQAVLAGQLIETDDVGDRYRFRQPLVAEILSAHLASPTRAAMHQMLGHRLLGSGRLDPVVPHHLAQSPAPIDRLIGARHALALAVADPSALPIAVIDHHVANGLRSAEEVAPGGDAEAERRLFYADAAAHASRRAWMEGRSDCWLQSGIEALTRSIELLPGSGGRGGSRSRNGDRERAEATVTVDWSGASDRVQRALMNLLGSPITPVGGAMTGASHDYTAPLLDLLAEGIEQLPSTNPYRWASHVHLAALRTQHDPSPAVGSKSARARHTQMLKDINKTVSTARKRLTADGLVPVLGAVVERLGPEMDPNEQLSLFDEMTDAISRPGHTDRSIPVRTEGLRAVAGTELGRVHRVEADLRRTVELADDANNPIDGIEARMLLARHLLWTGDTESARRHSERARSQWRALGLPEQVGLCRQRWLLDIELPATDHRTAPPQDRHATTLTNVERAYFAARFGERGRATEWIDTAIESGDLNRLPRSDLALLAAASWLIDHQRGASSVYDSLLAAGDRLVVASCRALLLGPASFYASLAAEVAGKPIKAARLAEAAAEAARRQGGSIDRVKTWILGSTDAAGSNTVPIESQR
jgi:DNA-binding SARP family transcriptional activator